MRCAQCGESNPEHAKFCIECGTPFAAQCPQCAAENPARAKFCASCGTPLTGQSRVQSPESGVFAQPPTPNTQPPASYTPAHLAERIRAEQSAMEARGVTDGERKTITALFADLKGSTALIEGLDPEEARAIIDPALQVMMDAVHQYDGYVAQALGDGIFALFGAPIAHEDHPQRALYAALRMQEAMRRYADTLRSKGYPPLLMRVGLNTGEVVVRSIRKDDLHADYVPVGHSTNLAARMEQLAAPGSIVISAYTHRLTDGYFAFKDLGQTQIKGVEEPLRIYEVLGAGPLRTRLQVAARRGLTRFVGRHSELEQMRHAATLAKAGHGQIVGVMGEPGLGKSRLFYEFKLLAHADWVVLEAYSVSHGKASPYLPVIELLKSYFDIHAQDDERKRREKVTGKVLGLDRSLEDTLPYLFALLGIADATASLQQMDPQIRRRRTFEALKKLLLRESLNQPLLLIFEDLHWLDSETQGFLDTLSEGLASTKILLLVNYRPEYRHEWGRKTYYTQLRLAPFGKAEAEEFLDVLLGLPVGAGLRVGPQKDAHPSTALRTGSGAPLQDLKRLILEKTEGTPFFMEEIVQELIEQGVLVRTAVGADLRVGMSSGAHPSTALRTGSGAPLHIPTTVQGVLAARIDRLVPEEKALLQQLSVIGREFPVSLLRRVITQSEDELYRVLSALQHKELLYEQPAFPEVEYIFKHALTQEVAYGTVLQERRKVLHEHTARAIEHLYHDRLEEHYSELAHHYSRSGNTQKAVDYLQLAGEQAVQRSANAEAIRHLTAALEFLTTLPETPVRAQKELTLELMLGAQLIMTKGYTATEVGRAYRRARELLGQVKLPEHRFSALLGLWTFSVVGGDSRLGCELADELMRLAEEAGDPALLVQACEAQGWPLFWLGDVAASRVQVERGVELYNPDQHSTYAFRSWQDPKMACLSVAAWALWELGYPDLAHKRSQESLALARELSHAYSLAAAFGFAAMHSQFRRETQAVREQTEMAIALATEHGFPQVLAFSTVFHGWALAHQSQEEEGIIEIHRGVNSWRVTGAKAALSWFLTMLAEAHGKIGQPEEGMRALAEALTHVHETGECFYEAELYRLKGELTLQAEARGWRLKTGSPPSQASSLQLLASMVVEREAEECFLKAIDISHKQQAKSLELRAVMSLVRLRQHQAIESASRTTQHESRIRLNEAHQILSEIYNWFTEGFDTKDLQEAKVLLEELS